MVDVVLTERQQSALHQLLALDAVPGEPLPRRRVFQLIDRLVPSDIMGAGLFDEQGFAVAHIELQHRTMDHPEHTGGPMLVGFTHWLRCPEQAADCGVHVGHGDAVSIGFRNGPDHVSQFWFDRQRHRFTEEELARLRLLQPVFRRLLRSKHTAQLPLALTVQERNILMEVAVGNSNPEIAANLSIAPATVRKHLEHAYRKLGVTNRLAAVLAFTGRDLVGAEQPPHRERITGWNGRSSRERV